MRGALVALLLLAQPVHAQTACDLAEAAELRAHLEGQASHARKWNIAWALIFGGAAVGSAVVGYADPFPELQTGLYVSAGKASIGALGRIILPLRIPVPDPNPDACTDVATLRKAVALAAKRERQNFWLNHVAGALVNGGGAAIIYWKTDSVGQALLSVAIGYPVGLLSNYTAPRGSWRFHREREATWTATVMPHEHGWTLGVAGAF